MGDNQLAEGLLTQARPGEEQAVGIKPGRFPGADQHAPAPIGLQPSITILLTPEGGIPAHRAGAERLARGLGDQAGIARRLPALGGL